MTRHWKKTGQLSHNSKAFAFHSNNFANLSNTDRCQFRLNEEAGALVLGTLVQGDHPSAAKLDTAQERGGRPRSRVRLFKARSPRIVQSAVAAPSLSSLGMALRPCDRSRAESAQIKREWCARDETPRVGTVARGSMTTARPQSKPAP